jgi:hypothetical protein
MLDKEVNMRLCVVSVIAVYLVAASSGAQVLTSEDGPRVANKTGGSCKDNQCKNSGGCASCLGFTIYVPLDAQNLKVHCYTVANYPNDYAHGDLHEVACGQDVAWSIFDSPNISTTATNKIVATTFHNRSGDRDRDAKVVVEYQKPTQASDTPDLSGSWRGPGAGVIIFSRQGKFDFSVTLPNREAAQGHFTSNSSISVIFKDDPGCCTGSLSNNGTRIDWSNGTHWDKMP